MPPQKTGFVPIDYSDDSIHQLLQNVKQFCITFVIFYFVLNVRTKNRATGRASLSDLSLFSILYHTLIQQYKCPCTLSEIPYILRSIRSAQHFRSICTSSHVYIQTVVCLKAHFFIFTAYAMYSALCFVSLRHRVYSVQTQYPEYRFSLRQSPQKTEFHPSLNRPWSVYILLPNQNPASIRLYARI